MILVVGRAEGPESEPCRNLEIALDPVDIEHVICQVRCVKDIVRAALLNLLGLEFWAKRATVHASALSFWGKATSNPRYWETPNPKYRLEPSLVV